MNKRIAKKVLLIGWDAADWQHINPLLDQGALPGLESLINRGVMGNLATLHPVLSPMLWNSIATGKTADKHGVYGFTQPLPTGKGVRPYASTSRKVKALWNICHQNDLKSNVVGWWASHPAEPINGCVVSNLFNGLRRNEKGEIKITPGTFHPAEKANQFAELKIQHNEITGDDILPFIPLASEIDQSKDPRLSSACKLLSDCASIQSITTHLLEHEPWDLTAVYFDAIDHFCHMFMYYHPPQMHNVNDHDFRLYKDVINGVYRFHDMILQRLIHLAGDDTTIVLCSDHGFQSGRLRPFSTPAEPAGPAAWHRDLGIIVMAGPGIKHDERIYGANIIDITPTILYQLGLPVGEDMDGRVLIDAFEDPQQPEMIPSWEDVDAPCGMHPKEKDQQDAGEIDETQSRELVKQFVALGYIEDPGEDLERAATNCQLELDYNLARVYLSTNRFEKAVELLVELVKKMPWEDRYWKNLAHCYFELGYARQSQKIMESLYRDIEQPPVYSRVFLAKTCFELGEFDQANDYLQVALALTPRQPMIHVMAGRTLARNNELVRAEQAFRLALEVDPDSAHAWVGLADVHLRLNRNEQAADAALSALVILYRLEQAHWLLGTALVRMKQWDRAKQAFETLLKFKSTRYRLGCHRKLINVCRQLGHTGEADLHSRLAHEAMVIRRGARKVQNQRKEELMELPTVPLVRERRVTLQAQRPRPQGGAKGKAASGSSGRKLTLVSGLPRSGTSLMMQMLAAGGLPAKTDGLRTADDDNPAGYYEWEAIKKINRQPELFDEEQLDQQAIKVISMLLPGIPRKHNYKIVFMSRPVEEIAASQQKMIERLGTEGSSQQLANIASQLSEHREQILEWLKSRKFIDLLVVDYPQLLAQPEAEAARIAEFLGDELIPNASAMSGAIRPELYRQRTSVTNSKSGR